MYELKYRNNITEITHHYVLKTEHSISDVNLLLIVVTELLNTTRNDNIYVVYCFLVTIVDKIMNRYCKFKLERQLQLHHIP